MKLRQKHIRAKRDYPLVSVIIPVWNDAENLDRCLAAVRAQTYPDSRLQVIVVDNGSSDGSSETAASYPEVMLLEEPKPGSYAARNTGLSRAKGTYIAFLDADCRPEKDWIEQAVAAASRVPNLGVLAGRIQIDCDEVSGASLYERIFAFDQPQNVRHGTCVAANWLSPKSVLDRFGGFDASLKSGGDSKLSRAIRDAGYRVIYCKSMIVHHRARESVRALVAKRRRVVGGKWGVASGFKSVRLSARVSWDALLRIAHVLKQPGLRTTNRFKIVGIITVIWIVGLAELTRLTFGFEPRR